MIQQIVAPSLGESFVLRNGVFVPPAYRRCDLGGGWTHWMRQSTFLEAYHELEDNDGFTCEHLDHRAHQVHDMQAQLVRACPAVSRA
jgi:hypothetical protein